MKSVTVCYVVKFIQQEVSNRAGNNLGISCTLTLSVDSMRYLYKMPSFYKYRISEQKLK